MFITDSLSHRKSHQINFRVYYEDTDAGGIIYHARYLHFMERARTEWLRESGVDHQRLSQEHQQGFMVAGVAIKYRHPAYLDDLIRVETQVIQASRARMRLQQTIDRLDSDQTAVDLSLLSPDALAAAWQRCSLAEVDLSIVAWAAVDAASTKRDDEQLSRRQIKPSRLPAELFERLMARS